MKTKTLPKKLSIKKHTVADLTGNEMKDIHGGIITEPTLNKICLSIIVLCWPTDWIGCQG